MHVHVRNVGAPRVGVLPVGLGLLLVLVLGYDVLHDVGLKASHVVGGAPVQHRRRPKKVVEVEVSVPRPPPPRRGLHRGPHGRLALGLGGELAHALVQDNLELALGADEGNRGPGALLTDPHKLRQGRTRRVADDPGVARERQRGDDGDVADVLLVEEPPQKGGDNAQLDPLGAPVQDLRLDHVQGGRGQSLRDRGLGAVLGALGDVALGLLHKGYGVGVGLADDEVVDVEELLQARRGEVALQRAVGPRHVGDVVGHVLALRVLAQQLHGLKEPGEGAAGRGGRPHEHVGGGEVVEYPRLLERVPGRDRDVDDPPRPLVRLVEGHVTNVVDQNLLELGDVHEVPSLEDALELPLQAADGVSEELEAYARRVVKELSHLLVCPPPHNRRHNRPRAAPRDDPREELLGGEGLEDPEVVHAQAGPPREHQGRLAKGVPALREELEPLLQGDDVLGGVGDLPQQARQHRLVLPDQVLCPHVRFIVKPRVPDTTQVANQSAAEGCNDRRHVLFRTAPLHLLETLADELRVIVGGLVLCLPGVAALQLIQGGCCVQPLLVASCRFHLLVPHGDLGLGLSLRPARGAFPYPDPLLSRRLLCTSCAPHPLRHGRGQAPSRKPHRQALPGVKSPHRALCCDLSVRPEALRGLLHCCLAHATNF
mmetsp:Transcript_40047/g.93077  ORF Transcript_40047/g.93077 Transcript_40047/m.93077 type:complete len:655 (-) Transcript_40047:175-2139(-)